MDIIQTFDSNVMKLGNDTFLRFNGRGISYAEVHESSRRTAALFTRLGVSEGDRIALMCYNTPGFVYAMLGAWRIEAVIVPVNHKMQPPEVDYLLSHSGARLCVFDGALAPVIERLQTRILPLSTDTPCDGITHFDTALDGIEGTDGIALDEKSPAEILYTSGTTGKPKGCVHSHRNLVLTAMNLSLAMSITREERFLMTVPIWHSSPLNNWLLAPCTWAAASYCSGNSTPGNSWRPWSGNGSRSASAHLSSSPPHSPRYPGSTGTTSAASGPGCTEADPSGHRSHDD
jgi:feruloyl-CoA synthase